MIKLKWIFLCIILLFAVLFFGCSVESSEDVRLPNLIFAVDSINEISGIDPEWFTTLETEDNQSEINFHLMLDAGIGMKGFTKYRDNEYMKVVSSINSVCANVYDNYTLNSYKFLSTVYLLKNKEEKYEPYGEDYMGIVSEEYFYSASIGVEPIDWKEQNGENYNDYNTDYSEIIKKIKEIDSSLFDTDRETESNNVFIIVSDFIPDKRDDSSFYHFTNELYVHILSKRVGCGIVAIKSKYDGKVNGLTIDNKVLNIDYSGEMPFYILVIGETEEVEKIISQFDSKLEHFKIPDENYETMVIDTRFPYSSGETYTFINEWNNLDALNSYDVLEIEDKGKFVSLEIYQEDFFDDISAYNFVQNNNNESEEYMLNGTASCELPIEIFDTSILKIDEWNVECEISIIQGEARYPEKDLKGFSEDEYIPLDISKDKYDYVYSQSFSETSGLKSAEKNLIWQSRSEEYDKFNKTVYFGDIEDIVEIISKEVNDNKIYINYTINPKELEDDMPYLIEIKVKATPDICLDSMENWPCKWTMDLSIFETYEECISEFIGGQTPYLEQSINGLRGENIKEGTFERTYIFIVSKSNNLNSGE